MKALRQSNVQLKGDERILGDSSFVDRVLAEADEAMERKSKARAEGWDLEKVANRVAEVMDITLEKVWSTGRQRTTVEARSLLCYWAVRELGVSMAEMARRLNISPPAVSKAVARGAGLAKANQYVLSFEDETTRN